MTFLQLFNLVETFVYISQAPFFWASMGLITGIGMFIGSIIYNGDVKAISKAIITLIVYITLLSSINFTRIYSVFCTVGIQSSVMAFGGVLTSIVISLFYITGMFVGVVLTKRVRKQNHDKTKSAR
jgi:large-conductance mechanosensitive channel